jgi:two-component system chemotaxis response regulator CheY
MKKQILIVDDSKTVRMSLTEILGRMACEVVAVASGEEALEQVDAGLAPSLIVTDYNMPGMNGIELIGTLRRKASFRFTPILVLTTESQQELRSQAKRAGATGWLVKPVQADRLVEVVRQVMPGS